MSPGRQALGGGLTGLGQLLLALGSGQPQQAGPAFQAGLAGFDEAQWRRAQQAREDELFQFRRDEATERKAERAEGKAKTAAAEAKWGELSGRLTDTDPTNDPTGLKDILPFLPIEMQMQMAPDLYAAPKPTDDLREYEFAKSQGYAGSFLDFQLAQKKAGASTTKLNVNAPTQPMIGTIPPGYVAIPDGNGMYRYEKIPGGPAADEAAAAAAAGLAKTAKEQKTGNIVVQDIDRAIKLVDESILPTTGYLGGKLSEYGGTAARDVKGLTNTIRANAGFAELQAMRDSSPTGGALGQVTERELAFLQATIGTLEQDQTASQFKDNLRRVKNMYLDIIHGPGKGPAREKLTFENGDTDADGYTIEELP